MMKLKMTRTAHVYWLFNLFFAFFLFCGVPFGVLVWMGHATDAQKKGDDSRYNGTGQPQRRTKRDWHLWR